MSKKEDSPVVDIPQSFTEAMGKPEVASAASASPEVQILQEEIARLNQVAEEAQKKSEENWERLLQKEADLQNTLRRAKQDNDTARKLAIEKFAAEMLLVVDSLEQSLAHATDIEGKGKDVIEGVRLTLSILLGIFEKEGIQVIEPLNETFNPSFHEAISLQETAEVKPNTVMMVVQKGYMLHQRLLRPARVVVAKAAS